MENSYWKKSVGTLIGAIWLYTLADIAWSITEFVNGLLSPDGVMGMMASMMGGGGDSAFGFGDLLEYLFPLLVLLGYWLFYSSLTDFLCLQRSDADREAVGKVRKSYLLMVIAILVGYLWIPGKIAALVLMIVAYVKLLSGYRSLKRSATFPEEARRGAGLLFASTVWLLVGYVIGMIPLVGDAIESVIGFVVFFCVLAGWGRIRRGAPELNEAEAEVLEREEAKTVRRSVVPAWWFPVYIGISLISSFIGFALQMKWLPEYSWQYETEFFGISTFELVSHIKSIVIMLLVSGFCCFLLAYPKAQLNRFSRVGLILFIAVQILYLLEYYLPYLIPMPQELEIHKFYMYRSWLNLVELAVGMAGIILFVWSTCANLTVKISLTVKEVLGFAAFFLFALYWMWANDRFPDDPEAARNFVMMLSSSYYLAINVLAFVAVLIPLICCQREPAEKLPAA